MWGGTLTGIAFILPSFLMVVVLAALYVQFGSLPWIQGAFYGVGAAVIAIITRSALKLVRTTLGQDWFLWIVFGAMAITTAWKESEIVWLFIVCGIVVVLIKAPPNAKSLAPAAMFPASFGRLITGVHGIAALGTVGTLFLLFVKAGGFVFGSRLPTFHFSTAE